MSTENSSHRFFVERRVVKGRTHHDDVWTRDQTANLAGRRTLADARGDREECQREAPSYFTARDFRIVKVTTITEVVK
jgi:hypothetical protein